MFLHYSGGRGFGKQQNGGGLLSSCTTFFVLANFCLFLISAICSCIMLLFYDLGQGKNNRPTFYLNKDGKTFILFYYLIKLVKYFAHAGEKIGKRTVLSQNRQNGLIQIRKVGAQLHDENTRIYSSRDYLRILLPLLLFKFPHPISRISPNNNLSGEILIF